jgi:ribosome-associated protein
MAALLSMAQTPTTVTLSKEPLTVARQMVDIASEKLAEDILLLDVRKLVSYADYLVILTAGNIRQLSSLADEFMMEMKGGGVTLHHREGTPDSGWVLLDYTDVVVHIFSSTQRDFYQLEQVWRQAKQVVRIQ